MDQPTTLSTVANAPDPSTASAGPNGQPPAQPPQPFVPYRNEIYRFSLRRIGADWGPAMRLTLVLGSLLALGALLVASAWGFVFWHVKP